MTDDPLIDPNDPTTTGQLLDALEAIHNGDNLEDAPAGPLHTLTALGYIHTTWTGTRLTHTGRQLFTQPGWAS